MDEFFDVFGLLFQYLNIRIDYVKFREILSNGSYLFGAFAYGGNPTPIPKKKKKFLKYLKECEFVYQSKPTQTSSKGKIKQKGIDIFKKIR